MSKTLLGLKYGEMDCETILMYCYFSTDILSLQSFYHREKEKKYCWRYTAVYESPEINVVSKLVLCFWFPLHWNRPIHRLVQLFFSQCFLPKIVILHLEKRLTLHSSVNTIAIFISCVVDCLTEPSLMHF